MIPAISATHVPATIDGPPTRPVLVLGPSLGTSAATLWSAAARHLVEDFDVVVWDLPGHGETPVEAGVSFTMAELAAGVLSAVDAALEPAGRGGSAFGYAGDSVGGAVGLQLALDAPERVTGAVLLCTGAKIGDATMWGDRIAQVGASGTSGLITTSAQRWFGPGFLEAEPERGSALLHALQHTDAAGYAQVCGALADFDVRDRLGEIAVPVLAVAGSHDVATPPASLREIADGVRQGSYVELDQVAHLAPAERPGEVAALIREHLIPPRQPDAESDPLHAAGMRVRRAVLGDAHVDRAIAATTDLTADFQDFITRYAWGSVWTRPGLDRRSRSMITITALIAHGHDEELAMHLRAARRNSLSWEEIREVLLQSAIYCGVPAANTAFRIASQVRAEEQPEEQGENR